MGRACLPLSFICVRLLLSYGSAGRRSVTWIVRCLASSTNDHAARPPLGRLLVVRARGRERASARPCRPALSLEQRVQRAGRRPVRGGCARRRWGPGAASQAADARNAIEHGVRRLLARSRKPLLLSGDHSVTYPVLRGFREEVGTENLAARLIQVGIRTLTPHQRAQSSRLGTEIIVAGRWRDALSIIGSAAGPVYVSLDLDVLEPMLAPGVSHPEPGGLTVREGDRKH